MTYRTLKTLSGVFFKCLNAKNIAYYQYKVYDKAIVVFSKLKKSFFYQRGRL